jgi:hypothetical protein
MLPLIFLLFASGKLFSSYDDTWTQHCDYNTSKLMIQLNYGLKFMRVSTISKLIFCLKHAAIGLTCACWTSLTSSPSTPSFTESWRSFVFAAKR